MTVSVLYSVNIGSQSILTSETILATLPVSTPNALGRVRIRGHLNMQAGASTSSFTVIVRQGTTTSGTQIYSSGAISSGATSIRPGVFEVEDDTNWIQNPGQYVVTCTAASGSGTCLSGYATVELIP
jgi:hypothetical protein